MDATSCIRGVQPDERSAKSSIDAPLPDSFKDVIEHIMAAQEDLFLSFFKRWQQEHREKMESVIANLPHVVQGSFDSLHVDDASRQGPRQCCSLGSEAIQELPQPNTGSPDFRVMPTVNTGPLTEDSLKQMSHQLELPIKSAQSACSVIKHAKIQQKPKTQCGCVEMIKVVVNHQIFELFSASIILANAITIAYASEYAMNHLGNQVTPESQWVERCFCAIYTIELILRLIAAGCKSYLCADGTQWNRFDMILVLLILQDQLAEALSTPGSNLSFLRVVRLLKMLRLLRMIRFMRMFRELRLILVSVLGCAQSILWSCILIFIIVFMFGICFLQACTAYLADGHDRYADVIERYWGSVPKSMLSLYLAGTNGKDWSELSDPLWEAGVIYFFLFLFYIAFFLFVIMNTLTSLVVEATRENSEKDIQHFIHEEMKKKELYIKRLAVFFDNIDSDAKGEITYPDFVLAMESPEMYAFSQSLAISASDLKDFFEALSGGGKRSIDLETFVVGCIKLTGAARNADIIDLIQMQKRSDARITKICTNISFLAQEANDRLCRLHEKLGHLKPVTYEL